MGPPVPGPAAGRLRLRPWLEQQIHSGVYPGVSWLDQSGGVFQIPWKHAARHGWSIDRDASLFRSWAMYTGRFLPGRDKPDPKTWKANFRCALNSLPDVKELREQSMKRGSLASRVYRLLPPRAPGRRRRGQQGCEAAAVRHIPESPVPLDRFSEAFCRARGFPGRLCEEGVCYGLFQSRDRESLPPYGRVKQEEGATAEQHSYSSSFLQLLPQTSSCTPHTQDMWDSSTDEQEQAEAVYKIVDHLSTTDPWGQSGDHPGWRPASSSLWEDCYCKGGDVDALACPMQTERYGPTGTLRSSLEDYTMGLSQ